MLLRTTLLGATALVGALASFTGRAADGQIDPSFGVGGVAILALDDVEGRELRTRAVLVQPDGKLVFGGGRNKFIDSAPFDPHMRATLTRLNADGSPDASFGGTGGIPGLLVLPDLVPGDQMQVIEDARLLADGSIVAVGSAEAFGPLAAFAVKVDAGGVLDPSFGVDGVAILPSSYLHAMAIDAQGRIVAAGERVTDGAYSSLVVRLNADGSLDSSFGPSADGQVTVDWDGVAGQGGYLTSLALTPDGHILVAGQYEINGVGMGTDYAIARLDTDGMPDASFGGGAGWRVFRIPGDDASMVNGINKLLLQPDGAAVFGGYHQNADGNLDLVLGRIGSDGATDAGFGDPATPGFHAFSLFPGAWNHYATGVARQDDGKLIFSVSYSVPGEKQEFVALRVSPSGQLDADFADAGLFRADLAPDGVFSESTALTLLPDGRPILAGAVMRSPDSPLVDLAAVRLTHDSGDRIFADGFE